VRVHGDQHTDVHHDIHQDIQEILISAEQITTRLAEIGAEITRDYAGRQVLLVGVLKGAFILMADLARHIDVPVDFDFMAVSSYGSATQTSGVVRILKDLDLDIAGRHVIVVEDIVDSGLTLNYLLRNLRARGPASLEVMSLLSKPDQARVDVPVRYQGFAVPNVFVVGYGLDYDERYRNLPYVGTLKPAAYAGDAPPR
jgi:hypoxanthine phosphoribosyltransferase